MIYLTPNSTNTMYLVCDDVITVEDPIYLFRFAQDQSTVELFIELSNSLSDNPRADKFTLILPDDLDLVSGDYNMTVFQSLLAGDRVVENMVVLSNVRAVVETNFDEDKTYLGEEGTDIVYKGYAAS